MPRLHLTGGKVVGPIHPKAMPVILATTKEFDVWLRGPWSGASALQRPLADAAMKIVASGEREDRPDDAIRVSRQEAEELMIALDRVRLRAAYPAPRRP